MQKRAKAEFWQLKTCIAQIIHECRPNNVILRTFLLLSLQWS